jgi:REP element-mobilizing transposase RayT
MMSNDPAARPAYPRSRLVAGLHTRGYLPHLKREGAAYFVSFRLADTLPREVLLRFKQEREAILEHAKARRAPLTLTEQEQLFVWYCDKVDGYLDAGHGACWLRRPEIADLVAGTFGFFDGRRYELRAWVVMPNHVHVVVWPRPPWTLSHILHSWKSFTAIRANQTLGRVGQPFWQRESFDHLIRNDDDLARCCAYTVNNPVKAGLCARPEDWKWSSVYRPAQPPTMRAPK